MHSRAMLRTIFRLTIRSRTSPPFDSHVSLSPRLFKVCSTSLDLWGHRDTRFISSPTGLLFQDSSGRWHCTQGFAGVPEVVCEPLPGLQQRSRNFWSKFVHKSLHAACLKQVQFIVNFPPRVLSGSESHNVGLLRLSVPVFLGALCLRGCAGVQTFLRGCDKLVPCAMPSVDNCRWDSEAQSRVPWDDHKWVWINTYSYHF